MVNYLDNAAGTELDPNDPILSYSSETVAAGLLPGLIREHHMKKISALRRNYWHEGEFRFNILDMLNLDFKVLKKVRGAPFYLTMVRDFDPVKETPPYCILLQAAPLIQADIDSLTDSTLPGNSALFE